LYLEPKISKQRAYLPRFPIDSAYAQKSEARRILAAPLFLIVDSSMRQMGEITGKLQKRNLASRISGLRGKLFPWILTAREGIETKRPGEYLLALIVLRPCGLTQKVKSTHYVFQRYTRL
jgi:hypothetical protein